MQINDYLYQKKLYEPLAESKPTSMKGEGWTLPDRQALGAVRLSLAKNVAYNVVNEKTRYDLFKALSNMYEKPGVSNKVFLIRQLVNTKMKEGASVVDNVNEFNSNLSRLISVDIKFNDEVQALLLLSSLPESWSGTITTVSGSTRTTNEKDKGRGRKQDRGKKQNRGRSKSKKRGQSKNRQDITCWNCNQKGYFQNQCPKPVASKDKEVNIAVKDYDDTLVCCVENTIEDRIMDYCASFHATFCKEDKTLDITGVGDLVLKTFFGSLVVARGNKRGSLYMVEVPSDRINTAIDGRGNTTLWHQKLRHMSEKGMKILALNGRIPDLKKAVADPATMLPLSMIVVGSSRGFIEYYSENEIRMFKTVPKTPQQNGVAERMNQTLNGRAKSMRLHLGLQKMFWEDSVNTVAYLINRGPSVPLGFKIPKEEWQGKEVSLAHLKVFVCDSYVKVKDVARDKLDAKSMKCTFIGYGLDEIRYRFWDLKGHKDQVVLEDSPENLANKSMVTEHGLSLKITQSPCGSSNTSDGSENSGSFEDNGRSDEEDSED
ncbi:retrovirus-related pol polyprotein from transposon TNT 1-94 [Tanacetum coccineum]